MLQHPDYQHFGEAGAVRFNQVAKSRPIIYKRLAEYLVDRFDLSTRPGIGIDIGGGPGDLVLELTARSEQFYWISSDINTWYARSFAEDALKRGVLQRTGFVFANACDLPFKSSYADLVLSRGAYQFWPSLEQGVKEIYRVLRPGGWAFIGRGFPPTMPEEEVRALLEKKLAGGPTYDPAADADRFGAIMESLAVSHFEIIRHQSQDPAARYGVWLCFQR